MRGAALCRSGKFMSGCFKYSGGSRYHPGAKLANGLKYTFGLSGLTNLVTVIFRREERGGEDGGAGGRW